MYTKTYSGLSESEYGPIITDILQTHRAPMVLALRGDLGAGKTTFTQKLAATLGVTTRVTSPTFTILQRYETTHPEFKTLYHLDVYRVDSLTELTPLRFRELISEPGSLVVIEWAERIVEALSTKTPQLIFEINNDNTRTLTLTSFAGD